MRTQDKDERFYISIENNFSFALVMRVCDWPYLQLYVRGGSTIPLLLLFEVWGISGRRV